MDIDGDKNVENRGDVIIASHDFFLPQPRCVHVLSIVVLAYYRIACTIRGRTRLVLLAINRSLLIVL